MTAGVIIFAAAAGICLIWMTFHKIRNGSSCCGEREKPDSKVLPGDRNPKHYPHRYIAQIEGMVCANCVRNVENAFHSVGGIYAKADLGNRSVQIYSKETLTEAEIVRILNGTSYTLIDLKKIEQTKGRKL